MADEQQDEIVVQVPDEPKPAEGGSDPVADLKSQYEELQEQQKRDQEARKDAETRARTAEAAREQAEQTARTAQGEAADTRITAVDQAIESAKAEVAAARSAYKAAMEAGDWDKAGEAQERISDATTRRVNEENKKSAWAAEAERVQQLRQQRPTGDPIDDYINGVEKVTPNSARWLREHRDWVSDKAKNVKLTAAHWDAVDQGIAVDSPEYFEHVERKIGLKTDPAPKAKTNGSGNGDSARRPSAAPVAPVTPSAGGTSGGVAEVRLTKGEAASATDGTLVWNYDDPSGQKRFKKGDPIGLTEMARRKKVMTEQGHYDKTRYEA